ncbi:MAG: MFS transporter [Desulfosarcina sp.]|nr:MFS transporter [Desulfosarcina sp.]MBC2743581.1 MFS transporter [Desulfosarcina sp.]MBC2766490.1 MFS transporter [Desulfosarcina sp.]
MNSSADPGTHALVSSPRIVFSLLFLLYMFDYIDRLVIVSLFPSLSREWGLTDTQCGLLVSAVYWSILIFTLPVSVLIDRWSRKKSIGLMALLWSAATLACAFTRNFNQLFVARTAIGLGEAGYAPGGTAMIATMFPKAKRARMLGIWNASIPLGSALGIVLGGVIAEHFGWRHAFGIVALPGVIVAVLFFFVRDYRTIALVKPAGSPGHADTRMGWGDIAGHFFKNRTLAFNNLAFAANTFVTTALMTWLPSYFQRVEDLSMSRAATKGGVVMLLAIIGAPLGGFLTDRWMKRRKNARLLFPAISSTVTAVILLVGFRWFAGPVQYALLLCAGISAVAFVPAAVAVTQDMVHPGLRAVSLSLCVIVQHVLGSALGPPVIGALSDRFGLETAMAFLPLSALLAGGLFFAGSFFHAADSQRVEGIHRLLSSTP